MDIINLNSGFTIIYIPVGSEISLLRAFIYLIKSLVGIWKSSIFIFIHIAINFEILKGVFILVFLKLTESLVKILRNWFVKAVIIELVILRLGRLSNNPLLSELLVGAGLVTYTQNLLLLLFWVIRTEGVTPVPYLFVHCVQVTCVLEILTVLVNWTHQP